MQHIDLSRLTAEAVKGAVFKTALTHPATIFPALGGVVGIAAGVILELGLEFVIGGAGFILLGGAMFPINYFVRYGAFRTKYFKDLREENEEIAQEKLETVIAFLDERNFDQGARQVEKIQNSMESFERVLSRKFDSGEFAYARYHKIAEQVMNNTLSNLEQIVTLLEAIDSIDPDYIQNRIREIGAACDGDMEKMNDSQKEEMETLEERWNIREGNFETINKLLSINEKALTELEKIATSIATSNTTGKNAEAELASDIEKLNGLSTEAQNIWG